MRHFASAMVVVDGVESTMSSVDPNDIENISILKDAAASAIYGVRAANGVILITTKNLGIREALCQPTYPSYDTMVRPLVPFLVVIRITPLAARTP